MRKRFDISYREKIERGECRVITQFGEPAEIVKWNCKGRFPILAVIDDGDTSDACFYNIYGSTLCGDELWVIEEEDETKGKSPTGATEDRAAWSLERVT
jgi:hypothetical protein